MQLGRNKGNGAYTCLAVLLTGMLFLSAFLAMPAFAQVTTEETTRETTGGDNTGGNNRNEDDDNGGSNRQVCEQVVNLLLDQDVDQDIISGDVSNNISGDDSEGGSIVEIIADLLDISVNQVQECIQESDEDVIDDPGGTLPFTGGGSTFLKGVLADGLAFLALAALCTSLAGLGLWMKDRRGW